MLGCLSGLKYFLYNDRYILYNDILMTFYTEKVYAVKILKYKYFKPSSCAGS